MCLKEGNAGMDGALMEEIRIVCFIRRFSLVLPPP